MASRFPLTYIRTYGWKLQRSCAHLQVYEVIVKYEYNTLFGFFHTFQEIDTDHMAKMLSKSRGHQCQ